MTEEPAKEVVMPKSYEGFNATGNAEDAIETPAPEDIVRENELAEEADSVQFCSLAVKPEDMMQSVYDEIVDGLAARAEGVTVEMYAAHFNEGVKEIQDEAKPAPSVDKRPHYQCDKKVYAHKIAGLKRNADGSVTIKVAELGFTDIRVLAKWVLRHAPHIGDYIVYYEDGYVSVSPAKPFEAGYTLIEE